ncbi:MAG: arylsulfatase [Flammeovirgaceae bacterium]|nr:arylsulfatase [Flammeovirgaceae bacterium]
MPTIISRFLFLSLIAICPGCFNKNNIEIPFNKKTNILVIMADDMGYSDIGCYGGEINTPNIDGLAKNGLKFTQFYNTARCCPTRASLLSGLYPHQAGIGYMMTDKGQVGYKGDLSQNCITIAEALKPAGYSTYLSGKWHVTKHVGEWSGVDSLKSKHNWPLQRGFDQFYGTIRGSGSFYDPISLTKGNDPIEPESEEFYYTDAISQNAVSFIKNHFQDQTDDPFFCYVAFTAPHWPLHALEEDIQKYKGKYNVGWDAIRAERYQKMRRLGLIENGWELSERDPQVPIWDTLEHTNWQERRMEVYAAQVDRMDQGIGKIVEILKENKQFQNTLIIFLADNGGSAEELSSRWKGSHIPKTQRNGEPVIVGNENINYMPGPEESYQSYGIPWANVSNTPFRMYKHWVHEGGISSPLIVSWPKGIEFKNELRKQPSHLVDIMATCLEVSESEYPLNFKGNTIIPYEGKSLIPAFSDLPIDREAIYWEHEGNRAIRVDNWKLVAKGKEGPWELYNLNTDRTENKDLASLYSEKVSRMSEMWDVWAIRTNVLPYPD